MPTFEPTRLSRQLELVKITPIVRIKTSCNKHLVQYIESLESRDVLLIVPRIQSYSDN